MKGNQTIIDALKNLASTAKGQKEPFKARAYARAANTIREHDKEITHVDDVDGLPGIGKSIKQKIQNMLNTGLPREQEEQKEQDEHAQEDKKKILELNLLMNVHGIGPKKANELVEKGISLKSLKNNENLDELNKTQRKGLLYYSDFLLRIPYNEMKEHERMIRHAVNYIQKRTGVTIIFDVVGSFRRKNKSSGDIDVVFCVERHNDDQDYSDGDIMKDIVGYLREKGYLLDTLSQGSKKLLGVSRIDSNPYRRIDLLFVHPTTYPFALLYFTGSANFNIAMRKHALKNGYSLSEYGLKVAPRVIKDSHTEYTFPDERSVFTFLGLKYVPPKDREGSVDTLYKKLNNKIAK